MPALDIGTATMNAAAEMFHFFSTDEGQGVVADIRATNKDFNRHVAELFEHIHSKIVPTATPTSAPTASTVPLPG